MYNDEKTISEGQITRQLREQEKEIDLVNELLGNLEDRLAQVIINEHPSPENDDKKDPERLVPIANIIRNNTNNIANASDLIKNITDRLEI